MEAKLATYHVSVKLDERLDLYHACKVLAGIQLLADAGIANVDWEYPTIRPWGEDPEHGVIELEVEQRFTKQRRHIAIDLHDRSDKYWQTALDESQVYFKRGYRSSDIEKLAPELQKKVLRMGPNFAARTTKLAQILSPRYVSAYAASFAKQPAQLFSALAGGGGELKDVMSKRYWSHRKFLDVPPVEAYEQTPYQALEQAVLLQTRVWTQDEVEPDNAEDINALRLETVRALRATFKERFVGGLMPFPYAKENYPEELTQRLSARRAYVAMSRRPLISVYVRGLHHSIAFKLGETLAGAQCLVSEPILQELPSPLVENKHYFGFTSPDQCVEACQRLFDDPGLAFRMRQANHEYYHTEVAPKAHALRLLERAFSEVTV
jgi:hypothetical protein